MTDPTDKSILKIENLHLHYRSGDGVVQAVDGVDLELGRNEALVVLGESGCGKSSLAKAILRLLPRNVETISGRIWFAGDNVMALNEETFRHRVRWNQISIVMQAAMNSLNPVIRVGAQVAEPLVRQKRYSKNQALRKAAEIFAMVGIPSDFLDRYPFELSGGMRQRAVLAMALVTEPAIVVLDEPTSALDVLTQANIMNVLKRIKRNMNTSFILITHDISTSSEIADRVALMYAGQIVECSPADMFFRHSAHPYSQALLASVPRLRQRVNPEYIPGQPPSLINPSPQCRFADRCRYRFEKCDNNPPLFNVSTPRQVRCWLFDPDNQPTDQPDQDQISATSPQPSKDTT